MTVIRKPKSVDDFISGALLPETAPSIESIADIQPVKVRMPKELLNEIDASRSRRKPRPSRHQYILEALYEKVASEKSLA
jgi:hypothetical protein